MSNQQMLTSDADIRKELRSFLLKKHANNADFVLIEEVGICQGTVRLDMLAVHSSLDGYEIKSDRDSLRRLKHQIDTYGKVLDRITIVVGERHYPSVMDIVPDWWGVMLFKNGPRASRLRTIRRPKKNGSVEPRALVQLLWHQEAIELLEECSVARGVKGKRREIAWDKVCQFFKTREIARRVRARLKTRKRSINLAPL